MTPKEKAEELFINMYTVELCGGDHLDKEAAKQCALIAVDEIIKSKAPIALFTTTKIYWQEVKNEIKKL